MAVADFAYDAFVSYRHREPDNGWVRRTLVPALETAGLRVCLDVRHFVAGVPLVLEMARAAETSRFTVAVLSPAYLTSAFTELESVLAEHLGQEQAEQRLLVVRREPCEAPPRLRPRLVFDMTDDAEVAAALPRLVAALRGPAW